jgi:hypothetical protein
MSDVSQGPGWWLASDGRWYPPESQPNYVAPPPPQGPAVISIQPRPQSSTGSVVLGLAGLGMLLIAAIGLFLPWATGGVSAGGGLINASWSTTGIDAHPDGIIYLVLLIVTGMFAAWNLLAGNRNSSLLLFLGWIALLAQSIYEIVYISGKSGAYDSIFGASVASGSISRGSGLAVCAVAGLIGTVLAVVTLWSTWSRDGVETKRLVIVAAAVLVFAVVGAGVIGHVRANSGSTGSVSFGNSGGSGNTGNSG